MDSDPIERRLAAIVAYTGARAFARFLREFRADRARRLGDTATQGRELHDVARLFREMGATGHAERVARELGS